MDTWPRGQMGVSVQPLLCRMSCALRHKAISAWKKGHLFQFSQGSVPHPTTYNGGTEVTVALLGPEFPWTWWVQITLECHLNPSGFPDTGILPATPLCLVDLSPGCLVGLLAGMFFLSSISAWETSIHLSNYYPSFSFSLAVSSFRKASLRRARTRVGAERHLGHTI